MIENVRIGTNTGSGVFLPSRTNQTCLSPWERCRAATERACTSDKLSQICARFSPLSHLLCKCQLSRRESQERGRLSIKCNTLKKDLSGRFPAKTFSRAIIEKVNDFIEFFIRKRPKIKTFRKKETKQSIHIFI